MQKLPAFFIVVLFALAGFSITFLLLNTNYKEYKRLPEQVTTCLENDSCISFKVTPVYKMPAALVTATKSTVNEEGKILFHYNPAFLIWTMLILLLMSVITGAFPVFSG